MNNLDEFTHLCLHLTFNPLKCHLKIIKILRICITPKLHNAFYAMYARNVYTGTYTHVTTVINF